MHGVSRSNFGPSQLTLEKLGIQQGQLIGLQGEMAEVTSFHHSLEGLPREGKLQQQVCCYVDQATNWVEAATATWHWKSAPAWSW